jgi:hypothetical protein
VAASKFIQLIDAAPPVAVTAVAVYVSVCPSGSRKVS